MTERDHPTAVEGVDDTLDELTRKVGQMRYDALAEFILCLKQELARQALADNGRGRVKLSAMLQTAESQLGDAHSTIERIWKLCKPHI